MKEIAKFLGLNQKIVLNPFKGNIGDYYKAKEIKEGDKELLKEVLANVEGTAYRDENNILLKSKGELYLIKNIYDSFREEGYRFDSYVRYSALELSHNNTSLGKFIYHKSWGDNHRTKFGGSKELMNYLGFEALPEWNRNFFKNYGYDFPQ